MRDNEQKMKEYNELQSIENDLRYYCIEGEDILSRYTTAIGQMAEARVKIVAIMDRLDSEMEEHNE